MPALGDPNISLRFPTALGTDEVPNWITFRPTMIEYGAFRGENGEQRFGHAYTKTSFKSYATQKATSVAKANGVSVSITNPFKALSNRLEGFVQDVSNLANVNLDLPNGLGNVNFDFGGDGLSNIISGRLNLGSFNINIGKSIRQNPNTLRSLGGINMYLPPELASQVSANYAQKDLTAVGQEAINFVGNNLDANLTVDTLTSVATAAISDIVSDSLSNVIQRGLGRAKNNYSYAIFQGMQHRTFSYSFVLVAKNQNETKEIKKICDTFMYYMLPVRAQDDFHFYDMPCMWQISYRSSYLNGEKIPYFDQPSNCFLQDVKVSYGADALGHTYNDGAPSTVKLDLKFMEIEPLLRTEGAKQVNNALLNDLSEKISGVGDSLKGNTQ